MQAALMATQMDERICPLYVDTGLAVILGNIAGLLLEIKLEHVRL